jgi:hypothetical protein
MHIATTKSAATPQTQKKWLEKAPTMTLVGERRHESRADPQADRRREADDQRPVLGDRVDDRGSQKPREEQAEHGGE